MTNELNDIVERFRTWYPDCPPLRWRMREAFVDRWCRIDNFPGGPNLAKTPEERRCTVERNTAVAAEALGVGNRCAVIMVVGRDPSHGSASPWVARLGATIAESWLETWSGHPIYQDDVERMKVAVASCEWCPERFQDLILDVATNRSPTEAVFVALDTGRAYSPWDGGADLFVQDMPTAHALWNKYLAMGWTPPELYTGKPPKEKLPRGFPYEWRTLPWDEARNS